MVETTSEEENEVKRVKRTEDSLRDLWDNIKCTNIRIIEIPEEEEKKKGYEKIFKEIILEIFPNMEKEIVNWVQELQGVPYRINPRRNTSKHILVKLTKTKHKERVLKSAREKQQVIYKGNPIRLTADLSAETLQARGNGRIYLSTEREKSTAKITVPGKDLIQKWWRNKKIFRQAKLRELNTTKPALQQMLKGLI